MSYFYKLSYWATAKYPYRKRKWIVEFMDFSFVSLTQNDSSIDFSPFYKRLKMTKFRRHCEQILQKFAWQSINLKANLPLDCHEFARSRFANSRNDKTLVILTCLAIPHTLCIVILSLWRSSHKIKANSKNSTNFHADNERNWA